MTERFVQHPLGEAVEFGWGRIARTAQPSLFLV
jgi:hypothetical protein